MIRCLFLRTSHSHQKYLCDKILPRSAKEFWKVRYTKHMLRPWVLWGQAANQGSTNNQKDSVAESGTDHLWLVVEDRKICSFGASYLEFITLTSWTRGGAGLGAVRQRLQLWSGPGTGRVGGVPRIPVWNLFKEGGGAAPGALHQNREPEPGTRTGHLADKEAALQPYHLPEEDKTDTGV